MVCKQQHVFELIKSRQIVLLWHLHYLLLFLFQVPATVRFFGKGGMTAEKYDQKLFNDLIQYQPDYVFLTIGGNDIRSLSQPKKIAESIVGMIDTLESNGVKKVFFTEIAERGRFKKDPFLVKKSFNKQRNSINTTVRRRCNTIPLKARFPQDFSKDYVHLNPKGNRKFFFAVRTVIFALV